MCVERAFGHLKMVFRVLSGGERVLKTRFERVPIYILSCIVLHNVLRDYGFEVDEAEARGYLDQPVANGADRREPHVVPVEGDDRVNRDQLCRLWLDGAAQ